jgi:hypothetical protein
MQSRHSASGSDARRWPQRPADYQLRDDFRKNGTVGRRDTTVESIIRDQLASPPAGWLTPSTLQVNTALAERIITGLGRKRLVSLTAGDVERFLAGMVREGLATKTIGQTKGLLTKTIRRAQRDSLVGRNVAELADTPHGTHKDSRSMTLEQIGARPASGRAARPHKERRRLRRGRDPRPAHLEAHSGTGRQNRLQLKPLKTEKSRRTLQLPAKVAEALRAHRTAQAAAKLRLGPFYGDMRLVFCGNAGQPIWREGVSRQFKLVCKAAELGTDWHPHEQRHTFVSVLSDAGIDIEAIADAAGHVNRNVTRTVYRHQIADKVTRASAAMDQIFGQVSS